MSGLEKVMEELYPGYAKRKNDKAKTKADRKNDEETVMEDKKDHLIAPEEKAAEEPPKRRRRMVKPRGSTEGKTEGLLSNNMYTLALVGTIGMEGYPLKPGEKLVIAKLTPIPITK